jgi:hypothetical protein
LPVNEATQMNPKHHKMSRVAEILAKMPPNPVQAPLNKPKSYRPITPVSSIALGTASCGISCDMRSIEETDNEMESPEKVTPMKIFKSNLQKKKIKPNAQYFN